MKSICSEKRTAEDPDVAQVEPPAGLDLEGAVGQVRIQRRHAQGPPDDGHGAAHGHGRGDIVEGVGHEGDDAAGRVCVFGSLGCIS